MKNRNRVWAWVSQLKESQGLFRQAFRPKSSVFVDECPFASRCRKGMFHIRDYFPLSGRQKGGSEYASCLGHFLTDFNSKIQCATETHLGAAYPGPRHGRSSHRILRRLNFDNVYHFFNECGHIIIPGTYRGLIIWSKASFFGFFFFNEQVDTLWRLFHF